MPRRAPQIGREAASSVRREATSQRKDEHLDLARDGDVEPRQSSTLLDCVQLVHCALPELALEDVGLTTELFGKRLAAPLLITGMTGGSERAGKVNAELAAAAEEAQVAFGVGSQRAMAESPDLKGTFRVRDAAPSTVVIGNVGLFQAAQLGADKVRALADEIGADAMALHLNVAQELTQPEGDRDFRHGYRTIEALAKAFGDRLVVKETGCGIGPQEAWRLAELGVRTLDLSGAGGTSWVRVETLRTQGFAAQVGAQLSGWGIPTAAAVHAARRVVPAQVKLIASGGIRHGLDAARALALGADLAGAALPLFRAQQQGGAAAVRDVLAAWTLTLRQVLLLTGARTPAELRTKKVVITGDLKDWVAAL